MSIFKPQTFLGQRMSQIWQEIPIWESFFNDHPIKTFVELGTGNGGMSLFFALQCYQRGIVFHTFDNQKFFNFDAPVARAVNLWGAFHFVDLFNEGRGQVVDIIATLPHPMAIFFDNGDKPREWGMFAGLTHPGDFCIVHDYGTEFLDKDIGAVSVERILVEERDERKPNWMTAFFSRK